MNADAIVAELSLYRPDQGLVLVLFKRGLHPRLTFEAESIEQALNEGWQFCGLLMMDRVLEMGAEVWTALAFEDTDREFLRRALESITTTRSERYGVPCMDVNDFDQA